MFEGGELLHNIHETVISRLTLCRVSSAPKSIIHRNTSPVTARWYSCGSRSYALYTLRSSRSTIGLSEYESNVRVSSSTSVHSICDRGCEGPPCVKVGK